MFSKSISDDWYKNIEIEEIGTDSFISSRQSYFKLPIENVREEDGRLFCDIDIQRLPLIHRILIDTSIM